MKYFFGLMEASIPKIGVGYLHQHKQYYTESFCLFIEMLKCV